MNVTEKIDKIKSFLTDDKEWNINFLKEELGKIRNNNDSDPAVYESIKNLIVSNLDENAQKIYNECKGKETDISSDKLNMAVKYIQHGEYNLAKDNLNYVIKLMRDVHEKMAPAKCLNFNDIKQFLLYIEKNKPQEPVEWSSIDCSYAYFLMGYILIEEKNYSDAISYFDNAIKYNPIDTQSLFEKAEICKCKNDYTGFDEICEQIYANIFTPSDFARYLRLIAYYHTEQRNYELAYCILIESLRYEHNSNTLSEIYYLRKVAQDSIDFDYLAEHIYDILKKNNINTSIADENMILLMYLTKNKNYSERFKDIIDGINDDINIFLHGISPKGDD